MPRIPLAKFSSTVLLFMMVNLKAATTEPAPVITFPPSSAQKWILPNGLTIIVQEDRSAPVASVQAWCATGSIDEDQHLGAGLSHILEHMLFKGTKTRGKNEIAQKIQDVGGYINAYTSFDRTVYWIDVPKDGRCYRARYFGRCDDEFDFAAGRIPEGAGSDPARIRHGHG